MLYNQPIIDSTKLLLRLAGLTGWYNIELRLEARGRKYLSKVSRVEGIDVVIRDQEETSRQIQGFEIGTEPPKSSPIYDGIIPSACLDMTHSGRYIAELA